MKKLTVVDLYHKLDISIEFMTKLRDNLDKTGKEYAEINQIITILAIQKPLIKEARRKKKIKKLENTDEFYDFIETLELVEKMQKIFESHRTMNVLDK